MTEDELKEARGLVEDMEKDGAQNLYFEINGELAQLLARYIRALERHAAPPTDYRAVQEEALKRAGLTREQYLALPECPATTRPVTRDTPTK